MTMQLADRDIFMGVNVVRSTTKRFAPGIHLFGVRNGCLSRDKAVTFSCFQVMVTHIHSFRNVVRNLCVIIAHCRLSTKITSSGLFFGQSVMNSTKNSEFLHS